MEMSPEEHKGGRRKLQENSSAGPENLIDGGIL
jgi:hypothetical protein